MAITIKDQTPTILITALLVVGAAIWLHHENTEQERALLQPLREQNEALRMAADDNRRQIEATTQLLRTAVSRREGEVFNTDEELQKMNSQRMDALADVIAKKVQPVLPPPKSPDEIRQMEDQQVEQISSRMVDKIRPVIAELKDNQHFATDESVKAQFARNQELAADLRASQTAAHDAITLSQQIGTMYADSMQNQGLIPRILSFPADLVHDTVSGSIISSRDKQKVQRDVQAKVDQIERRIDEIQAEAMASKS